ncbi:MAG: DUF362 domain-containing protein [Deltaproteobacteria bacterium]|nr:DUF362 domain-containing protein [Deltaproteobacteria bacterium]
MDRREFLTQGGKAAALAALTGATAWAFHDRVPGHSPTLHVKAGDFEVPPDPLLPALAQARNPDDPVQALRAALDAMGGIRRFVRPGERVTLKPNAAWDRTPEQAANTNPLLVGEMARQCLEAGASRVVVTDVTCNDARRTFLRSGIREAAEAAGAEVLLARDEDFVEVAIGGELLGVWPVLRHTLYTDRLINMPVVKHHGLSGCTLGMKNHYGVLGGRRGALHQQIDLSIVELARFVRPTLTILDGTRVLLRGGPQGGSLDDVERRDTVLAATDPVAGDARACELLGLSPEQVSHIAAAHAAKLGTLYYPEAGFREVP